MEEILYKYWFLQEKTVPFTRKIKVFEYFSDSYHIHNASYDELVESGLFTPVQAKNFIEERSKTDLSRIYESFIHSPFSFMTVEDNDFPQGLKDIYDPPYGIYYNGRLPDLTKTVSIVGARKCSEYGKKMAFELGQALGANGYTVISGMARGIDSYGHKGCLDAGGKTLAVLGSGVDVIYPKENRKLYEQIVENGAVLSEFPVGYEARPMNFPQRNRIVSGLSKYVIVVEAALKSGSLITADFALEQGKEIFVVPGRIGDSLSAGCNRLINQGAGIIVSIEDFIKTISGDEKKEVISVKKQDGKLLNLSEEQLMVLSLFDYYPKSLAEVQAASNIDYLKLISLVYSLVRIGALSEAFKNHFVICS